MIFSLWNTDLSHNVAQLLFLRTYLLFVMSVERFRLGTYKHASPPGKPHISSDPLTTAGEPVVLRCIYMYQCGHAPAVAEGELRRY